MCLRREGHDRRRAGGDAAQRSRRLAGLLPRVRRTSVRDSSQTDGQLSHQAEAASGVAGAASHCRRGGRQTPGWRTCDSAARWPTSSVPPAIRHVLARGNGTSKRPARTPSGESGTSGRIPSALLLRNDLESVAAVGPNYRNDNGAGVSADEWRNLLVARSRSLSTSGSSPGRSSPRAQREGECDHPRHRGFLLNPGSAPLGCAFCPGTKRLSR
jgi:hypothetical protein